MTTLHSSPLDEQERLKAAWSQLSLILGFFPRIDTKLSVVLGIDLGMLAMLSTRTPPMSEITWFQGGCAAVFLLCLGVSFFHLYRGAFPHLEGGTSSLVYFRSIAAMTESDYRFAYSALSPSALTSDLLDQSWRNAKILTCKFHSLRHAYTFMIIAAVPWLLVLAMLSMQRSAA